MTAPFVFDDQLHTTVRSASKAPKDKSSPPSGSSSDTLHENDTFDGERKFPNISPISTATLIFGDLNLQDDEFLYQHKYVDRFSVPMHGNTKHHNAFAPPHVQHAQHFRRNNYHHGNRHNLPRGGGIERKSHAWISDEACAAQEFLVVRNSMKRQFRNSEVAKWKVADYIAHCEAVMASKAKKLAQQAQSKEDEANFKVPPISPSTQDMMRRCGLQGNFEQVSNYGQALGAKTIWCKDWKNGKDDIAPWPTLAELKWEGDDRAKTGVGRFPPLPREQGPPGIPWNQLQAIEQYPIDQIARIPTMEDVYLPVDEIDDEAKYDLLNKDLEDAMYAYLES
ncbi:hypothetical protein E8E12_011192 [Didymella heteroderae]|uniref:Uncharacterized protein n=1 Tax=Didymella heteroderae TaxID=1769908 RepID=A0A9P4X2I3_9PLEO|nr:hypothetical protein E8E12_011192 [Didymella heteroderae]